MYKEIETYSEFITVCLSKSLLIQYNFRQETENSDKYYELFAYDGDRRHEVHLNSTDDATDITDFETNYKATSNQPMGDILIKEEVHRTGGHYCAESFEHSVPAEIGWSTKDITFPFPIGILAAKWIMCVDQDDDVVEFLVAPDTVIGAITADVSVYDVELSVSSTVIQNTAVGYFLKIGSEDFGRVLAIDAAYGKVTVEHPASTTHTAGAYVQQTVKYVPHLKFRAKASDGLTTIEIGNNKIGTSYVPVGTIMQLRYYNHEAVAKEFSFIFEYLY